MAHVDPLIHSPHNSTHTHPPSTFPLQKQNITLPNSTLNLHPISILPALLGLPNPNPTLHPDFGPKKQKEVFTIKVDLDPQIVAASVDRTQCLQITVL